MAQKTLQVRLDADLYTTLDLLAGRENADISKLTRRLLTEYAANEMAVIQAVQDAAYAEQEASRGHILVPITPTVQAEPLPAASPAVIDQRPNLGPETPRGPLNPAMIPLSNLLNIGEPDVNADDY